jgi:hypothetical protein
LETAFEQQGFSEDLDLSDEVEFEYSEETPIDADMVDYGLGRFFLFFSNPFSYFVLKKVNNEFSYVFLEFFLVSLIRLVFLTVFYFVFFIFRGIFFLL